MKFAIINITAARFSIVVVVGVIILGAFLAMHPAAAAYAQPAAYSTSGLNLVADSCFITNIELG